MKKNLLLIFGSPSPEYYVDCEMTKDIAENIDRDKYDIFMVGIKKDGTWFYTEAGLDEIQDGETWLQSKTNKRAILSPESNGHLLIFEETGIKEIKIDVAFAPIPGDYGEDGKLPALFEMANIPYVGSGHIASGCGLDKVTTRKIADFVGLKQAKCVILKRYQYENNKSFYIEKIKELKYPLFVKPSITGSSIGVTKIIDEKNLEKGIEKAFSYCEDVLVEEGINGCELKVSLYGNKENIVAGSVCKLSAKSDGDSFNDYDTKYKNANGGSMKEIPANIPDVVEKEIVQQAILIHNALNCRDFSRVDFFLTDENELIFGEINTNPGFKKKSIYPLMMDDKGYSYKEIVNGLIQMALDRAESK